MLSKNKIKYIFTAILCMLHLIGISQVVQENFDHGSVAVSEGNCWEYDDVDIDDDNPILGGGAAPLAEADITGLLGGTADLTSPFIYFNGTGTVNFKHKLGSNFILFAELRVVLVDPRGTVVMTIFDHDYTIFGNASNARTVAVPITWTGYYKVRWEWTGGFLTSTDGYVDAVLMHGDFSADPTQEINGYCPAVMEATEIVCGGLEDDFLTTLYPRGSHNYTWTFNGTSGGAIDGNVIPNDQSVEIDWTTIDGNYTLFVQESWGGGLPGNQTYFYVEVVDQPDMAVSLDTVCEDTPAYIHLNSTAAKPYQLTYTDDLGNHTITINGSHYTLAVGSNVSFIDFISLVDANGCAADPVALPDLNIYYYPAPLTGAIYH